MGFRSVTVGFPLGFRWVTGTGWLSAGRRGSAGGLRFLIGDVVGRHIFLPGCFGMVGLARAFLGGRGESGIAAKEIRARPLHIKGSLIGGIRLAKVID